MTSDKQTVEPVAWRWRLKSDPGQSDLDWSYSSVKARAYGWIRPESWEVQPLYTAPASPSLGERREEIARLEEIACDARSHLAIGAGDFVISAAWVSEFEADLRAVLALLSRPEGGDG